MSDRTIFRGHGLEREERRHILRIVARRVLKVVSAKYGLDPDIVNEAKEIAEILLDDKDMETGKEDTSGH